MRASDAAYREVKAWIQSAAIPPGGLIDEAEAAERLGMSRTPVREALLRLQAEGLVEIGRGRGIRVLPLSSADMREIYQVISGLEAVAVALIAMRARHPGDLDALRAATDAMDRALADGDVEAWGNADESFHRALLHLSGNGKLHAVGCQMRDIAQRAHMVAVRMQPDNYRAVSTRRHAHLVDLLSGSDAGAAEAEHTAQRLRGEEALVGMVERLHLANL